MMQSLYRRGGGLYIMYPPVIIPGISWLTLGEVGN